MAVSALSSSSKQTTSPIPSSFDTAARAKELLSKTANLIKRTSSKLAVDGVVISSFYSNAQMSIGYVSNVRIPASYLLKTEDLPSNFRIQDFNDPRLYDEKFLKSLAEWINSLIESANHSQSPVYDLPLIDMPKDHGDFEYLRYFLMLLRDPILSEKAKEQVIEHELCHALEENRSAFLWLARSDRITYMVGLGIHGGFALCGLGLVLAPFVSARVALPLAGIGATLSAATIALARFGLAKCREIEKKCDLGAINVLKDASGFIYCLETLRQIGLTEKVNNPSLCIDDQGNNLNDLRHPTLTSRIAYCREWESKNGATVFTSG